MKTVLIADDQPMMRMLITATLAGTDLKVIEANNGDDAWQMLKAHRPDLALLDVQMPGQSGLDLVRAIRADTELASIPVILLTASAFESDVSAGLAAGANGYITKPFSPLDLLEEVRQALA